MTVDELRAELGKRGLETSGFEPELRVRLCTAMGVPVRGVFPHLIFACLFYSVNFTVTDMIRECVYLA